MHLVFCGTAADGLLPYALRKEASDAQDLVARLLVNGKTALCLEIDSSQAKIYGCLDAPEALRGGKGMFVLEGDLLNGFTLYGPFDDDDQADRFAQVLDGEWVRFDLSIFHLL